MAQQAAANVGDGVADQLLVRIKAEDGSTARNVTVRQSQKGRSVGTSQQQTCYICRKYLAANGSTVHMSTSVCCAACHMQLCK